ncbi:glycosyl transferase family 90-domain-containing protein [Mycena galericulata]|nr:glycosyl transferase family 90-domain-containing protein [Mycena galericulata]
MRTYRREHKALFALAVVAVCLVAGYHLKTAVGPTRTPQSTSGPGVGESWDVSPYFPTDLALAQHTFHADGLLEVNPAGGHPIFELIRRAEAAWADKLARASTTFPAGCCRRDPPKGFDAWWAYAREHNVQLPDDYDQIFEDLEPFWGIKPRDLHAMQRELEANVDSYTMGKTADSQLGVVNTSFELHSHLLTGSQSSEHLPPFRAVFWPHDAPNRVSDYFVDNAARQAAAEKRSGKILPNIDPIGWASACAPGTPARNELLDLSGDPPHKLVKTTFIHDHKLSMDPCLHPRHFWQHGQFIWQGKGPTPQAEVVPQFSYSASPIHQNIRVPVRYLWWDDKLDERLLWRGSPTGLTLRGMESESGNINISHSTRLQKSHRIGLVRFANELRGTSAILQPVTSEAEPVGEPIEVRNALLKTGLMDVALTGEPFLCEPEFCKLLKAIPYWRDYQSARQAGDYKYCMDGNGWSGRFERLLVSNSLVFKATLYPEWFTERIQPWVHFVPVQLDLSDVHDALMFFRGDLKGEGAHEDLARKIAAAGRSWSMAFWRKEDMTAYYFRLMLEYGRLMSEDRDAMSYKGDGVTK